MGTFCGGVHKKGPIRDAICRWGVLCRFGYRQIAHRKIQEQNLHLHDADRERGGNRSDHSWQYCAIYKPQLRAQLRYKKMDRLRRDLCWYFCVERYPRRRGAKFRLLIWHISYAFHTLLLRREKVQGVLGTRCLWRWCRKFKRANLQNLQESHFRLFTAISMQGQLSLGVPLWMCGSAWQAR